MQPATNEILIRWDLHFSLITTSSQFHLRNFFLLHRFTLWCKNSYSTGIHCHLKASVWTFQDHLGSELSTDAPHRVKTPNLQKLKD